MGIVSDTIAYSALTTQGETRRALYDATADAVSPSPPSSGGSV